MLAVVLVAVGGFAAWQFFSEGGPRPAEVLPDSTFALVTVDLDPSGGQKIEAIQTLRKFPSWKKRIGTAEDDVIKVIVEKALEGSPCKSFDYDNDVRPWIGSRAGLGGVLLGDDKPAPVLALQVKDADKAETGFAELTKCAEVDDEDDFGWTISGDYIVGQRQHQPRRGDRLGREGVPAVLRRGLPEVDGRGRWPRDRERLLRPQGRQGPGRRGRPARLRRPDGADGSADPVPAARVPAARVTGGWPGRVRR